MSKQSGRDVEYLGWCDYFTADPELGKDLVSNDMHPAGEGPLYFFLPLPNGDAVRVLVCEDHAAILEEQINRSSKGENAKG